MTGLPTLGPRGEGWVAIQMVLLGAAVLAGWLGGGSWSGQAATVGGAVGLAFVIVGLAFGTAAGLVLERARALTALPHPSDESELVQHGPYRSVRHPIYGGLVIAAVGWGLLRASPAALVVAAALLVFFRLKSEREEAWLLGRYPEYAAYRTHTRRLIPWVY